MIQWTVDQFKEEKACCWSVLEAASLSFFGIIGLSNLSRYPQISYELPEAFLKSKSFAETLTAVVSTSFQKLDLDRLYHSADATLEEIETTLTSLGFQLPDPANRIAHSLASRPSNIAWTIENGDWDDHAFSPPACF